MTKQIPPSFDRGCSDFRRLGNGCFSLKSQQLSVILLKKLLSWRTLLLELLSRKVKQRMSWPILERTFTTIGNLVKICKRKNQKIFAAFIQQNATFDRLICKPILLDYYRVSTNSREKLLPLISQTNSKWTLHFLWLPIIPLAPFLFAIFIGGLENETARKHKREHLTHYALALCTQLDHPRDQVWYTCRKLHWNRSNAQ